MNINHIPYVAGILISIAPAIALTASAAIAEDKKTNRELVIAVRNGDPDEVKRILERGADVNANDGKALISAATCGHAGVAKLIIERGADVDARSYNGWTPLMAAASNGRIDLLKLLLKNGADVNTKDKWGRTAIEEAAERGHWEAVRVLDKRGARYDLVKAARVGYLQGVKSLLDEGVDVNSRGDEGRTALIWASMNGHRDVTKLLLEWEAEVDARGKDGRSAMRVAQERGREEIAELLRRHGAKEWLPGILIGKVIASSPKSLSIEVSHYEPPNEISVRVGLKTKFSPFRRPAVGEKVEVKYHRKSGGIFGSEVRIIP